MHNSNGNRASLLSGLRTGGVRGPASMVPHTAGPGGAFQIPNHRYGSGNHNAPLYEDELDLDFGQSIPYSAPAPYGVPMTAGFVDNRASHFNNMQSMSHQQMLLRQAQLASMGGMGAMSPVNPMDQLQLQMMQAMGAYGYNPIQAAQVAAHQHALNAAQMGGLSRVPASAGPTQTSFEPRSGSYATGRGRLGSMDDVPMSAALGGKFGSRTVSGGYNSAPVYNPSPMINDVPGTPGSSTVVISGGVSLGGASPVPQAPSRIEGSTSWRRPSMVGAAPAMGRTPSPPKRFSPPSGSPPRLTVSTPEETDEFLAQINAKPIDPRNRPAPLSLANAYGAGPTTESAGIYTSNRASPPKTTSALGDLTRQMEGMNVGRARSGSVAQTAGARLSQPIRQPIGPTSIKSGEFATKNFASRLAARPYSAPIEIAAY